MVQFSRTAPWKALALCLALAMVSPAQQTSSAGVPAPDSGASPQIAAPAAGSPPPNAANLTSSRHQINNYEGLRVRDIQFRGISADERVQAKMRELLAQGTDQPLDRGKIRRSLQALYATGRFADLQVEADRTAQNEVRLVFTARENYFIGAVTLEGQPKRPTTHQLINATKLQLGELYTRDKLDRAFAGIKTVLADNGFYKAEVTAQEQFHPETQQVDVHFTLVPDGAARVGQVVVRGQPGYSEGEISDIAHVREGDTVTANRTTHALQRLRKRYQKGGRLEAQVAIAERIYHPQNNTLDYVFDIQRGPTVDIHVDGTKISRGKLKKLVPIYEEGAIDDDLLNEGLRNIRDYFQTQGFFDVTVRWERQFVAVENHTHVIYHVNLGMRHKLDAVKFAGNRYFSSELLRERMQVRPVSGFLTHGVYSETMLARDIAAIENMYRANGFEQVKITRDVQDDYRGEKGRIVVTLNVSEGPQTVVAALDFEGNTSIPTAELASHVDNAVGQPFSEANVMHDRDTVMTYYYDRGFPNVSFESATTRVPGDAARMQVKYTVHEGTQVFVDRVLTSGLHYTKPFIVRREFLVRSGAPLSQSGMLETQRRLYDLGIFNQVDVAVQNPDGQTSFKNLLYEMREARRWTFNYGIGFEFQSGASPGTNSIFNTAPAPGISVPPDTNPPSTSVLAQGNPQGGVGFSPRVSFDLTRLNFRGRDHTILFKGHLGELQKRALVSYDAPRWFDRRDLRLTFTGFYDNSRDVRTFTSERLEGSVQAEQAISRVSTLLYRYTYRRVKVDPKTLAISPELVPLLSRPVRVGMPSITYIRDKRNDPIDPQRGNYTTFDTGVASRVFGSAASFGRFLLQNNTYLPIKRKFVFARSTRIGVQQPFGALPDPSAIPLPERFFAGGANSHRGFALNQAGPRDLFTGFPLGGNATFVNSLELRLPPAELPIVGTNLSFAFFHDAGNVFETGNDMARSLFRWYQPNREACFGPGTRLQCRFDFMSQAVGTGIRYRTPIGPVRVDVSYNLNPPAFPYFVQCPATRTAREPCASLPLNQLIFQSGTLRHFNFFFSIGQSF